MQSLKARALAARAAREAALAEEEKKRKEAAQAKLAELEERIQRRSDILRALDFAWMLLLHMCLSSSLAAQSHGRAWRFGGKIVAVLPASMHLPWLGECKFGCLLCPTCHSL